MRLRTAPRRYLHVAVDKRCAASVRQQLAAHKGSPAVLLSLQRWFFRCKLARRPAGRWTDTLRALKLGGHQKQVLEREWGKHRPPRLLVPA